jgi:branched-chain amino acid transport system ATP-binding protein
LREAGGKAQPTGRVLGARLRGEAHVFPNGEGMEDIRLLVAAAQAGALSHGEQRQLEIAMVLATEPEVLLLDEPLAGMGAEESARMVGLLERLSSAHAILLVEHDMDAVFALADVITVMVNGQVLESGPPAAIRASENVQRAYLGHDGD